MRNDWFRRGVRMTHRFNDLERREDPLNTGTWDVPDFPVKRWTDGGKPCEIQEYGEHQYRSSSAAVSRPSGSFASISGPVPDAPQVFGMSISIGTKKRIGTRAKQDK